MAHISAKAQQMGMQPTMRPKRLALLADRSLGWRNGYASHRTARVETVQQVANRVEIRATDLVKWNISRYPNMSINSRVSPGTVFFIADPDELDRYTVDKKGEVILVSNIATRLYVEVVDNLSFIASLYGDKEVAEDVCCVGVDFLFREGDFDTTFHDRFAC